MSSYTPVIPDCSVCNAPRPPWRYWQTYCESGWEPFDKACGECTISYFTLNNTGVRYAQGVEKLKVFEISNPNASLVLLDQIIKSSERLLPGVIEKYLIAGYEGAYLAESIIKFKTAVNNTAMLAQSFKFTPFVPPPVTPPPRGRLA